jgi:carbonic anhydrase
MESKNGVIQTTDISNSNLAGDCNLKCSFAYDYYNSSCAVTNNGTNITIAYDRSNTPPVIYNGNSYTVSNVQIVAPSLHTFDGKTTAAEIFIFHTPVVTGLNLIVAIPVVSSPDYFSQSSKLLSDIINGVASHAPASSNSSVLSITNFNLNTFINPQIPFYSYVNSKAWIVFGKDSAITINQKDADKLKQLFPNSPNTHTVSQQLFMNQTGAINGLSGTNSDQIYIDCKPVNSSKDEIVVETANPSYFDINNKNPSYFDINNKEGIQFVVTVTLSVLFFLIMVFGCWFILTIASADVLGIDFMNKALNKLNEHIRKKVS